MSGNRTVLIIISLVAVGCLCIAAMLVAAGGYFYFNQPAPVALATRVSPAPFNPLPVNPIPPSIPTLPGSANPPAFPTITGGGTCDDVEEFEDQGDDHIRPGQLHPPYNSNPPTSGWHWADPKEWGIYSTPQVQEQLVHNLEHGGIVIQYNNLTPGELQRLLDFVRRTPRHIIVAPYPGLDRGVRVAFTAWTLSQQCDGVDLEALADFIDEFRDQGPEYVP
jgi:hypothetical protein